MRGLTRLECVARRRLAAEQSVLAGREVGNPKRATAHPTAERLLARFEGLPRTMMREGQRRRFHLTPLSALHQRLLTLLDFPIDISTRLGVDFHKPP